MINKLKYLFLLILCVGIIGVMTNVSAQTNGDKILVSSGGKSLKQSDINRLIEFYEWAFEIKLTGAQRERYQALKEAEFRENPAEAKKGNDELGGQWEKIRAVDEVRRREIQRAFIADFVPNLRKAGDNAEAQFLVNIYDGGDGKAALAVNAEDDFDAAGGDLSSLVGKWVWGRSGSTTYTSGGAMLGSNGSRHTYQFAANGAVEYTGIMNVMTGGCNMQVFKSSKGRASVSGSTLTIKWSPATFKRDDSCSPSKNYTKTLPEETETFQIKFKSEYGQKQLCLAGKEETCFSPTK